MKNVLKITVLVALIVFMACNREKAAKDEAAKISNELGALKIDIPTELKGNTEAVEFIKVSEAALNEYSQFVDKVYRECSSIIGKSEEELTMSERIKLIKVAGEMAIGMAKYAEHYAQISEKTLMFDETMTEAELTAWATVTEAFATRMKQIDEKYSKLNMNSEISE
jgi:tetrahydromethanopterin S-methyltransferase subunit H